MQQKERPNLSFINFTILHSSFCKIHETTSTPEYSYFIFTPSFSQFSFSNATNLLNDPGILGEHAIVVADLDNDGKDDIVSLAPYSLFLQQEADSLFDLSNLILKTVALPGVFVQVMLIMTAIVTCSMVAILMD